MAVSVVSGGFSFCVPLESCVMTGNLRGRGGLAAASSAARNFRHAYYKSLGVQGATDLEIQESFREVLEDEDINLEKLTMLCVKFGIPVNYRCVVWKLLLDVLPRDKLLWAIVAEEHLERFELMRGSCVALARTEEQPHVKDLTLDEMQFIRRRDIDRIDCSKLDRRLLRGIANVFSKVFERRVDAYWCFCNFIDALAARYGDDAFDKTATTVTPPQNKRVSAVNNAGVAGESYSAVTASSGNNSSSTQQKRSQEDELDAEPYAPFALSEVEQLILSLCGRQGKAG